MDLAAHLLGWVLRAVVTVVLVLAAVTIFAPLVMAPFSQIASSISGALP
jgi:hypothetical protein